MESSIYLLVKINIENLVRSEAVLLKNFHITINDIERLPYWQYEMLLNEIESLIKRENDESNNQNINNHNDMIKKYQNDINHNMKLNQNFNLNSMKNSIKMPKL